VRKYKRTSLPSWTSKDILEKKGPLVEETSRSSEKMTKTMKAVVFRGPYRIAVEDRPIPEIVEPTDVVIKVSYTALCGRSVLAQLAYRRRLLISRM
jgi:hypothetical protein